MITTSKKAQKVLKDSLKDAEDKRARDLGTLMDMPEGRAFIFDLINRRCGVFGSSFTGDSKTFLREGSRKVGIDLMVELQEKYTPQYVKMIGEAFNQQSHDRLVEEAAKAAAQQEEIDG